MNQNDVSAQMASPSYRLAALDRDVFLMREIVGLSYEEIAGACEITQAAVRSRLHRARQQLRRHLRPKLRGEAAQREG